MAGVAKVAQLLQRVGTAALWASTNPVLGMGEIGVESDTLKFKIGNNSAVWSALPYQASKGDIGLTGPAPVLSTTSTTTSMTPSIASKTFPVPAGHNFTAGMPVIITSTSTPAHVMYGTITSATSTQLVVDVTYFSSATAHTSWSINLVGLKGSDAVVDYNQLGPQTRLWNPSPTSSWDALNLPAGFTGKVIWYSAYDAAATAPPEGRVGDIWDGA